MLLINLRHIHHQVATLASVSNRPGNVHVDACHTILSVHVRLVREEMFYRTPFLLLTNCAQVTVTLVGGRHTTLAAVISLGATCKLLLNLPCYA